MPTDDPKPPGGLTPIRLKRQRRVFTPLRFRRFRLSSQSQQRLSVGALVVLAGAAVWGSWWTYGWIQDMNEQPGRALAASCASGPWAANRITAAGGAAAADVDPTVLDGYRAQPSLVDNALRRLRSTASAAGRPDLGYDASAVLSNGVDVAAHRLADIEVACAAIVAEYELTPNPPNWAEG
jgi:hypothetical protein